ncbi:MAG: hypothetical protein ACRDBM_15055, partial [Sporomusa sp.]
QQRLTIMGASVESVLLQNEADENRERDKDNLIPFSSAKCHSKNSDGQGFKSGYFFALSAEKYYSSLDRLDRRNDWLG